MFSYDQKLNKYFYYWLLISFFMVFLMVMVGGLTRLTNSGLSITEWELFTGILPPTSYNEWNNYFLLYKEIPQYKILFNNMTLEQFKIIFYWEYFHRILGRLLGLFFLIPFIYFFLIKKIKKEFFSVCSIILFLIISQGIIGWYMVKSGLVDDVTVSHYRLSLHLSMAIIIISLIFWAILSFRNNTVIVFFQNKRVNYFFYFLFILILLQIIFGAFVSGLDAGKVYQSWPMMNNSYFPDDLTVISFKDLINFNDHGLVQFYHRNIAYIIVFYIFLMGLFIFKTNTERLFKPYLILCLFLLIQIFLGIITLLSDLNIILASSHQICSLLLMLSLLNVYYKYIN